MTTDFFKNIDAMQVQGDFIICIRQRQTEKMTVSVVFKNENCGDNARKIVPPLVFPDKTVAELGEKFFADLNSVIPDTAKMFSSMEHYLKQREEAKKQSAIEKDKADKEKKEKEAKDKKFKDAMAKADELEKEGKFREAWMKVPDITEFPEKADEIRKRKTSLSDKFGTPSLFGAMEEATPKQQQLEEVTADYPIDETGEEE